MCGSSRLYRLLLKSFGRFLDPTALHEVTKGGLRGQVVAVFVENSANSSSEGQRYRPFASDVDRVPIHARQVEHILNGGYRAFVAEAANLEGLRYMRSRVRAELGHKTRRK